MVVIGHHCISTEIDCEDLSQNCQAIHHPLAAMLVILA
jgi:hypothetical protein